ncbi:hypothetical protein T07_8003 [Trichinella nelsoni]|uniref:Uncharacterized protein n=1 Tax=Trichinella nelsoni TaxID=6336 RepID=A0A0V0SJR7_9BILA|nr:hypothetical protein T07_8003 [Trichinella nelsoni]
MYKSRFGFIFIRHLRLCLMTLKRSFHFPLSSDKLSTYKRHQKCNFKLRIMNLNFKFTNALLLNIKGSDLKSARNISSPILACFQSSDRSAQSYRFS